MQESQPDNKCVLTKTTPNFYIIVWLAAPKKPRLLSDKRLKLAKIQNLSMPAKKPPAKKPGRKTPKKARRQPAKRKTKPIIVMLGNVGFRNEVLLAETELLAGRLPKANFVGIDIRPLDFDTKLFLPKNVEQKQGNFKERLSTMNDNSISYIVSNMALGHYTPEGKDFGDFSLTENEGRKVKRDAAKNTHETLKLAHKKLVKGGRLKIVLGAPTLDILMTAFKRTGFLKKNIRCWKISGEARNATYWTNNYRWGLYRVTAEK